MSVADDIESVHDYVEKLLARVRETSRPSGPASCLRLPISPPGGFKSWHVPTVRPAAVPNVPIPRGSSWAVERPMNLVAMREIANLSRELALERNARRNLSGGRGKLVVVALTSLAGGLLLAFRHRLHLGNLPTQAALGAFVVSLFWAAQYALLSFRIAARTRSVETTSPLPDACFAASAAADEPQTPIA